MIDGAENIDYSNRRSYPISVEPFFTAGIALGDIDGDGDLDIVQASDKQENQIYFNDGTGQFGPAQLFGDIQSNTRNIEIADLNGDGALDILEICRGTPNLLFINKRRTYFKV